MDKSPAYPLLADVCQDDVVRIGDTYYVYYAHPGSGGGLYVASSADGTHFLAHDRPVLEPGDWDFKLANSAVYVERDGSLSILYESLTPADVWQIGLAKGSDPFNWTKVAGPLATLQHGTGAYGGPWLTRFGGTYHLWYHGSIYGNLPTDIYHSTSSDLMTWTPSANEPVIARSQSWEVDQVADPTLAEANGRTFLFYDGDDNVGMIAAINVATFDGSLDALFADPFSVLRRAITKLPWYPRGM